MGEQTCCLHPGCCAAHLRHFLAAALQTLVCTPGEREGQWGEGRREGASAAASAPAGWAVTQALLRPSLPRRTAAPDPLPGPPTQVDCAAKHAHPRTLAGQPRIPKDKVSIWDPQQVPVKQSRRSRPPERAAPCKEAGNSPRGKSGRRESGIYFFHPSLWHRRTRVTVWQRGVGRARGFASRAHLTGWGRMASAGGRARQGLTACARLRLRARPPSSRGRASRRSLPSAPQSRRENLPLRSASTQPPHNTPSLLCHPLSTRYPFRTVLVSTELE